MDARPVTKAVHRESTEEVQHEEIQKEIVILRHGVHLSKRMCFSIPEEIECMS